MFERDSYIVYYHKLGVSFTELALELHIDRTTAGRAYQAPHGHIHGVVGQTELLGGCCQTKVFEHRSELSKAGASPKNL